MPSTTLSYTSAKPMPRPAARISRRRAGNQGDPGQCFELIAGVADYSTISQYPSDNLTTAKWLDQQQDRLEVAVEPYVSRLKSPACLKFRGRKVYLKPGLPGAAMHGVFGLQYLYQLRAAIDSNEIHFAISAAMSLNAQLNELDNLDRWNTASIAALAAHARSRENSRLGGLRTSILAKTPDVLLQVAYRNNRHRRDWLSATTTDLRSKLNTKKLSAKTVSRELRKRGISDNG